MSALYLVIRFCYHVTNGYFQNYVPTVFDTNLVPTLCIHQVEMLVSIPRYFRKGCYFGLACFANMPVESELERGARMKSVGILSPSYTLLYRYMHFLENQVR